MRNLIVNLSLLACLAASCGGDAGGADQAGTPTSSLPETYYLPSAPSGALDVAAARAAAVSGEKLVVRGDVGGSTRPFVEGLAAFTLVDGALDSCEGDGMGCETPWDYCCVDPAALRDGTLTVEFRGPQGPLATGARGFHGLDHLSGVVVEGLAEVDERGNVTLVASGLHVARP